MNHLKFKLEGFEELKTALNQLGPELATKAGQSAIRATAKVGMKAVYAATPVGDEDTSRIYKTKSGESVRVDYGHARANLRIKKLKPKTAHTVGSTITFGNAFWMRFLEFGTVNMAARPVMQPAFDSATIDMLAELNKQLGKAIDRLTVKHFGPIK
ncbi:HK97 gp10 family phage protein [Sphingobium sp. B7D2B]|uniref:HK97-gp10 family putative phage morphogenesis protein n=1 Tax=Sphingobium sp. B7D2B TaxID=2940583 RepID=UPI002224A1F1|nr:HK97-gp10 family putative phage morphogenesis protein [Sphingobium sp. B7D2B]MCW2365552.1 HK97 gp10 family phage protein [Sphingobium sp. B7D2B]